MAGVRLPCHLEDLLTLYYLSGIFCFALFLHLSRHLEGLWHAALITHGKTVSETERPSIWRIPKSLFSGFYAVGLVTGVALLRLTTLPEVALLVHLARRYLETVSWPYSRQSKMHLVHALVGLSYYPVLVLSVLFSEDALSMRPWHAMLIAFASLVQSYCHWQLYRARSECHHPAKVSYVRMAEHSVLFRLLPSPHYLMEIVIYGVYAAAAGGSPLMLLNWIFVLGNLAISARSTSLWHQDRFGEAGGGYKD